jgi:2-oxo-4-hydroxy-4-carboxy-5-ureidoimidazoline decarboxylase
MEPPPPIDRLSDDDARAILYRCCGSSRWVERVLARRPFGTRARLLAIARDEWFALQESDWREAFSHHPRIGDLESLRERFAGTSHLAEREQGGIAGAPGEVLAALAEGNRAYEQRFGYIFIVCATGRSAAEMLALLRARLQNDPGVEIHAAAREQAAITEIRLRGSAFWNTLS